MFCRWLRMRPRMARIVSLLIFIFMVGSLLTILVGDDSKISFGILREVLKKNVSRLTAQNPRHHHHPNHEHLEGEWAEAPMVLRDQEVVSRADQRRSLAKPDLTLISIDTKLGPIFAIKHVLRQYDVEIIEKNLSPYCQLTDSCSDLELINRTNILRPRNADEALAFWRRYRHDPEFQKADGFICIHPVSLCEMLIPFQKPLILIVDDRYEMGRTKKDDWLTWNSRFTALVNDPANVVMTTNAYDMEYVKYFTHLSLPVVPYACDYVTERYHPRQSSYLLMPVSSRELADVILNRFKTETGRYHMKVHLDYVLDLYGTSYKTSELVRHAGLVVIPHRTSSLALTELIRLEIPLFLPSVDLLARWQLDFCVMNRSLHVSGLQSGYDNESSSSGGGSSRSSSSSSSSNSSSSSSSRTKRHSPISGMGGIPDPNDDENTWAVGFWITYCDYFSWPGVKHFGSVEDLASKLNATTGEDLYYASQQERMFNEQEKANVGHYWKLATDKLKSTKDKAIFYKGAQ